MSCDDTAALTFAAGVEYATDAIGRLLDELTLCRNDIARCDACDAYHLAVAVVAKWAAAELAEAGR